MIVEDISFEKPKTKDFSSIIRNLSLEGKKILMLTSKHSENVYKSGRNIPGVHIQNATDAATYDLVNNQVILIQKSAVEPLCKAFVN